MAEIYITYKTKRMKIMTAPTDEALSFCQSHRWHYNDGKFIWDLILKITGDK